ncbi:MAG: PorV/PorQ family protein [Candidatus Marinimicrobia bacterium]|nr:PorV/PorQ family protein [Candidatus Neomarinimicrobiota bacterium]
MRKMLFKSMLGLLGVLLLVSSNAFAGGRDRAGSSAAPHLLIPVGARGTAMGGSGTATSSGIDAIFWNPAGISRSTYQSDLMFSHMDYFAGMDLEYVAAVTKLGTFGSLGFSVKTLVVGDIAVTTEDQPDGTGEILNPNFITLGIHYSKILSDRVSVGITSKIINESFLNVGATGIGFDVGVQYKGLAEFENLSIGIVLKDFGPAMTYGGSGMLRLIRVDEVFRDVRIEAQPAELPTTLEIGTSYSYSLGEASSLNISGVFQSNNFADDEFRIGAEWSMQDFIYIRGGIPIVSENDDNPYIFGPSVGAGVSVQTGKVDLILDYAFRDVEFLEANHIFSIHLGF